MKRTIAWLAIACIAGPASADLTQDELTEFLGSQSHWAKPIYDERSELYLAIEEAPADARMSGAAEKLAAQWRIPAPIAAKLIEATVVSKQFDFFGVEGKARRAAKLFDEAVAEVPHSSQAWALKIHFRANFGGCGDIDLRNQYLAMPLAEQHYLELGECENWLPRFLVLYPDNLAARFLMVKFLSRHDPAASLAASRWVLDFFDMRTDRPLDDMEIMALRQYWVQLGTLGLFPVLLAEGARLAPSQRDAVLHRAWKGGFSIEGHEIMGSYEAESLPSDARMEWMAALIAANRLDEARTELASSPRHTGYLADAAATRVDSDLYARYVGDGEEGLLWNIVSDTGQRVAARFLAENRLHSAAELLRDNACNRYFDDNGWDMFAGKEITRLPPAFQAHLAQHSEWYAQARHDGGCRPESARTPEMSSRLARYPEIPLSEDEKSRAALPNYTGKIPLPASFELVRAERAGDDILAVCISPAVDPGGEVGGGGYWLLRSQDGGANWGAPKYLGFQQQNPYVVSADARVSMFAPGVLRLEVEVAELDPETITFPPVALGLRREAKDLYIDIPHDDLERDSDGDGLTDLLEAKLATDPQNVDSDGDGISDRFDDFPQASARGNPHALAPIIVDLLRRLVGFERAGIIEPVRREGSGADSLFPPGLKHARAGSVLFQFVSGDARQFEGLRAEGQVIVLDERQVAEIRARSGPFYPLSFPNILVDLEGKRALVKWSAGWTGGTLVYRMRNGKWIGKEGQRWITRQEPPTLPAPKDARHAHGSRAGGMGGTDRIVM